MKARSLLRGRPVLPAALLALLALLACTACLAPARAEDPPAFFVTSMTLTVPNPGPTNAAVNPPIAIVELLVDVAVPGPASNPTFTISKSTVAGGGTFPAHAFAAPATAGAPVVHQPASCSAPAGATCDEVRVYFQDLPASAPGVKRYLLQFRLFSNFEQANPVTTLTGDEVWTIDVNAGFDMIGACPISQVIEAGFTFAPLVPSTVYTTPRAEVSTGGGFDDVCANYRPGVDVVLVLDKSGSMSGSTLGTSPRPKREALADAVGDFVNVWGDLRANESIADGVPPPDDKLGLVFFDSDARQIDAVGVPAWAGLSGLMSFDATLQSQIAANIGAVPASGGTSLGDGLVAATGLLSAGGSFTSDNRAVILAMSDGQENTTLRVDVDNPANPTQVRTFPSGSAVKTPLPNQADLSIYSVTVGTSTAVSPDINEDIARATGGFYINTEDDAEELRPFFLQLLQNFLQFNSYQTVRLAGGTASRAAPFTVEIPVTTTTASLSVNVLSDRRHGRLRLMLDPPGPGGAYSTVGNGSLRLNTALPDTAGNRSGVWTATVEALTSPTTGASGSIPFSFVVITDDTGMRADFDVAEADYASGDDIVLHARLSEFEDPILNAGGGSVRALVVQPGQSIGTILAQHQASPANPPSGDPLSPAEAELAALLQENPKLLLSQQNTITLYDDGQRSHGDATAGDGVYSARYTASVPGHYNFVLLAEGEGERTGRFARTQIETVHVRAVPDFAQTSVAAAIDGNVLMLTLTPRTADGSFMTGFQNYFWFTTATGDVFKPVDRLDGTFAARYTFSGARPPAINLHFLRVSSPIDDETTPENLPVRLGDGTVFIPGVEDGKPQGGGGGGSCLSRLTGGIFGLVLLPGLLALGVVATRRRRRR